MLLKVFFVIMLSTLCLACSTKELENQIFLIPEGYIGSLEVIYDVPQDESAEYEGDARVHRFNKDGISLTPLEFPSGAGTRDAFKFFYVDKDDRRTPILLSDYVRFEEFEKNIQDTATYIMDASSGTMSRYQCVFDTKSYYVGSYKEIVAGIGFTETSEYLDRSEHPCFKSIENCPCNTKAR